MEENEKCEGCNGQAILTCDHKGTGRDKDGWCTQCDCPTDKPGRYSCEECF